MPDHQRTVAIMQPYFFPYGGYFRLLAQTDLFVIYDCVQFPRRGWVHRNKLIDSFGDEQWLTLPLAKQPQSTLIKDLMFSENARCLLKERLNTFPLATIDAAWKAELLDRVLDIHTSVADYLVDMLELTARRLGLQWRVCRSSDFAIPDSVRGQDRIIEIAKLCGARRYLNSPGGVELYDQESFVKAGLELAFLPSYRGPYGSMLGRLLAERPETLAAEINV